MKKVILFIFATVTISAHSQTINFDDPNFKAILLSANTENFIAWDEDFNSMVLDINGNNEIELSEAALVYRIDVPNSSNISSLIGIEFFQNLTNLRCLNNLLITLDVSTLSNLESLNIDSNDVQNLVLNPQIKFLKCRDNQLSFLDLAQFQNLENVDCRNNNLAELDLTSSTNIFRLSCGNNELTSLSIQGLPLSGGLSCENNLLTQLDLTGVGNPLPSPTLIIDCSNNLFTSLNTNVALKNDIRLVCNDNPNLTTLYVKNGEIFDDTFNPMVPPRPSLFFENTTNLELICADDFNFEYLEEKILDYNLTGISLTTGCTLDIEEYEHKSFTFYPNPITYELTIAGSIKFNTITIYDLTGRQVYQTGFESLKPINLEFLNSGQYTIQLNSTNENQNFLILKK